MTHKKYCYTQTMTSSWKLTSNVANVVRSSIVNFINIQSTMHWLLKFYAKMHKQKIFTIIYLRFANMKIIGDDNNNNMKIISMPNLELLPIMGNSKNE